ncbi:MAG: alpha/beta fold hydrolase [Actinomycetota bacterium]
MSAPIMPGAEAWSFEGSSTTGLLALHGFTGNPSSVRPLAEAASGAGHHVELPRLAGHGTVVDDMLTTTWADWSADADAAFERLAERVDRVVVSGLSMGGSLALWMALQHPETAALVCINPATVPQGADVLEMVQEMIDEGIDVAPGVGSDIADPNATETAYEGTPLRPLLSLQHDGLAPMTARFGELTMPLTLLTSRQDHVVSPSDSEHLAGSFGGSVEHLWLERSFHVATKDYDREAIVERMLAVLAAVTPEVATS